jgi:hypothetical protein
LNGSGNCFVRLHRKRALHGFDAAEAAIMTTVLKEVSKGFGGSTTGPSYISALACRIAWRVGSFRKL